MTSLAFCLESKYTGNSRDTNSIPICVILGIFFSGNTFASFRVQSCEECCEESFEECCEECCEECASHCSITVDFQEDVDFPTEMRAFQVRDATRH